MKKYSFFIITALLFCAGCSKENNNHTYGLEGRYWLSGSRNVNVNGSPMISEVTDTITVQRINQTTLSLNGINLTYDPSSGNGSKRFRRMDALTIYQLTFVDYFPDSIYYIYSHYDGVEVGISMSLRGGRISE